MPPGTLIADETHEAGRPFGACAVCQRATLTGQRIARLAVTGKWVHTSCTGQVTAAMLRRG
jgi:hypothetical protein